MRFQFGTAALLLASAFVAITLGGCLTAWRAALANDPSATVLHLAQALVFLSPWWIPIAFLAFALGRKRLSAKATVLFAVAEAAGFGGMLMLI